MRSHSRPCLLEAAIAASLTLAMIARFKVHQFCLTSFEDGITKVRSS